VVASDGVDDKTEYFYSFNAGPGEVTITLDVKAEKGTAVSSVDIVLFDAKSLVGNTVTIRRPTHFQPQEIRPR